MPTDVAILPDDPIDDVIAALNTFEPARDDTDNLVRLYDIFRNFLAVPQRDRAMPAMFSLLERFPDAEFGSPGPLVHELEAIPGYLPPLRDSLRRQPTYLTVWMANRSSTLNSQTTKENRGCQSYVQHSIILLLQSRLADLRKIS